MMPSPEDILPRACPRCRGRLYRDQSRRPNPEYAYCLYCGTIRISDARRRRLMLVLSRKVDQSIVIQGDITIIVLATGRNRVTLGIQAPPGIDIRRQELVENNAEKE